MAKEAKMTCRTGSPYGAIVIRYVNAAGSSDGMDGDSIRAFAGRAGVANT